MEEKDLELMIKKALKDVLAEHFNEGKKEFTVFTIPQVVWIIELYYLFINCIYNYAQTAYVRSEFGDFVSGISKEVIQANEYIMDLFVTWMPFVNFATFSLFVSGVLISLVSIIPYVRRYSIIRLYSSYGVHTFFWFGLISLTYNLYELSYIWFPITFLICIILIIEWEQLWKYIKQKLNLGESSTYY